jgi:hypothetical protein
MIDENAEFKNLYQHNAPMFIQQNQLEKDALIKLVKQTASLGGAMAEVGVCEGGSAWIIRETDKERDFHLFDTFKGLPNGTAKNFAVCNALAKPIDIVKEAFRGKEKMFFHEGVFPHVTGRYVENMEFSFVHIDVDIYRSILDCLGFFYYRMLSGGIILVHDYGPDPLFGQQVSKAVDLFLSDKPEELHNINLQIGGGSTQIYIIKEKKESIVLLPDKNDPEKTDKLIDYLQRKEAEGRW